MMKFLKLIFIGCAASVMLFSSCATPKDITILQDLNSGAVVQTLEGAEIKVRPDDKLAIIVNSKDPELADLFNLPIVSHRIGAGNSSAALVSSNQYVSYYTVTPQGTIDFPVLGDIHLAGMRRYEVAEYIKNQLVSKNLVKDPVVTVEFANAGVSVMGEVNKPGRVSIDRERLNVIEAITAAGDMTIYGNRKNVLVIRDEDGVQKSYRLDLTNAATLYSSPAFYLKQNDIVIVDPNNYMKRQSTVNGNTTLSASFWVSVASLLTSICVLIFK